MHHCLLSIRSVLIILIVLSMGEPVFAKEERQILVIANKNAIPYQKAIVGIKSQFPSGFDVNFSLFFLSEIENKSTFLAKEIIKTKPDLIFTLGKTATKLAIHSTKTIPIVFSMVSNKQIFSQAKNVTGIGLRYPISTQFKWLKEILPNYTRVAIIYNTKENSNAIKKAKDIALNLGLDLIPIIVDKPQQLPSALDQLENNIQVLLSIPDKVVMSPKTAKMILLSSFKHRVPLIGLSDNWVKSGALYGLSWDYQDIGQQSAIQALKVLSGKAIQNINFESPRKIQYLINHKIADRMKIDISEELLKNAKKVFH